MNTTSNLRDRYPGLNSFRSEEEAIFFGRRRETTELLQMVRSEQAVVLFSKSGLGKSSLLNAGLVPALRPLNFRPIRVRFQQEKNTDGDTTIPITPIDVMLNSLHGEFQAAYAQIGQTPPQSAVLFDASAIRLWERVKASPFPNSQLPVFLFDQFEEFFAYPLEQQKEFASQMAELMHDQAPVRVINWLLDMDVRTEAAVKWSQQPPIKCVFSIRSDRLADMHSLKPYIPLILRNRYELSPLQQEAASDAIIHPAYLPQDNGPFATPPFKYQSETLITILDGLSNKDFEIEGAQLQIVCQHVEERLKEEYIPFVNQSVIPGRRELMRILDKFYRIQLRSIGNESDITAANNVLEKELVEDGRRVPLPDPKMMRLLGTTLSDSRKRLIIKQLQNARLIRSEDTHLGTTYELSHDTLIAPVEKALKIRKEWQERRAKREEVQRKDHEIKEQAEKLQQETEAKERALRAENRALLAQEKAQRLQQQEKEAKERALHNEAKAQRLTSLLGLFLTITIAFALWNLYILKQSRNRLRSIINAGVTSTYQQGRNAVAYRLRKEKEELSSTPIFGRLWSDETPSDSLLFAPYSGRSIVIDSPYVAIRYGDGTVDVFFRQQNQADLLIRHDASSVMKLKGSSLAIFQSDSNGYNLKVVKLRPKQLDQEKIDSLVLLKNIEVRATKAAVFSNTGRYLALIDQQGTPKVYSIGSKSRNTLSLPNISESLQDAKLKLQPGDDETPVTIQCDKNNRYAVITYRKKWSLLYDLKKYKVIHKFTKEIFATFSTKGDQLAVVINSNKLLLVNMSTGERRTVKLQESFYDVSPKGLAFIGDSLLTIITRKQSKDNGKLFCLHVINLAHKQVSAKPLLSDFSDYWLSSTLGQLLYKPRQNSVLRYSLKTKQKDTLFENINLKPPLLDNNVNVMLGRDHVLIWKGKLAELRNLKQNKLIAVKWLSEKSIPFYGNDTTAVKFYSANQMTDTHLLLLYPTYVRIIDLNPRNKPSEIYMKRTISDLKIMRDLFVVQLGSKHQRDQHINPLNYWAFFINNSLNHPDSLGKYVYPKLTPQQRREFGLGNE